MYRAAPNCRSHSLEVGKPKNGWSGSWQRSWTAAPTNLIARPAAAHPGWVPNVPTVYYPGGSRILHGRTDRSVYSGAEWVVGRSVARERLPCQRPGHYPASAPRGVGQPYPRVWGHTRWKKADTQFKLNIRGFMLRPLAIKYLKISY